MKLSWYESAAEVAASITDNCKSRLCQSWPIFLGIPSHVMNIELWVCSSRLETEPAVMMLPSRGVCSSRPAIALRHCIPTPRQTIRSWSATTRQFSLARPNTPSQQWSRNSSALRGQGSQLLRLGSLHRGPFGAPALRGPGVFSQGAGASRALSLWPFGSKAPPKPAETLPAEPATSLPETPATFATPASDPTLQFREQAATQSPLTPDIPMASDLPNTFGDMDPTSILDIQERIGYLKDLGLEFGWGPSSLVEWALEHTYIYTGLPWWGTVAIIAVGWRIALFVPTLRGSWHQAKLQECRQNPEFKAAETKMWDARHTNDYAATMVARSQMIRIQKQTGASSWKSLVPMLISFPFTIGMFRVLRAMAALPVPSLENGGVLWFADLSVHDPTYILPLVSAAVTAWSIKQSQAANVNMDPNQRKMGQMLMYVMTPVMLLCTMWLPAVLQWFFLCFGAGQAIQTTATLNPTVRRWAQLPPLKEKPMLPAAKGVKIPGAAGAQYQAPAPSKGGITDMMEGLNESMSKYTGGSAAASKRKAMEYEEKRAKEDQEKRLRRDEDRRRRKMLKERGEQ
ncbi:60Kd inner membrane protein-domain-containing protein [Pseudomassariella vexata]|uniref:60Kd inner membrane protein-domain-containing protein n=1 Tax=Pseudomassariella vexata TaxID=1141098 RepID=A0A1Y2EKT4_9PEZI|nr:60Kd inner membrane protein-domain-containing protein [Pseudomassariella vexata]ORY72139.1 60Kd inner membrane protein-domain-containing protein [Pseudomassariella vexata]